MVTNIDEARVEYSRSCHDLDAARVEYHQTRTIGDAQFLAVQAAMFRAMDVVEMYEIIELEWAK